MADISPNSEETANVEESHIGLLVSPTEIITASSVGSQDADENEEDESPFVDAGRDDMFVDAPDQLSIMSDARSVDFGESGGYEALEDTVVGDDGKHVRQLNYELSLLQASLEKANEEHQEEKEMLGRELYNLRSQLKTMANHQLHGNGPVDNFYKDETRNSDMSLQFMIVECSKSVDVLQRALEEQSQSDGTRAKDQEIENLSAKVDELNASNEVLLSRMESLQETSQSLQESSDNRVERDLQMDIVTKRLLASLASVVPQDDLPQDSSVGRISVLENRTSVMIENYKWFLSEIDQLEQCLTEVVNEVTMPGESEYGVVFDMARRELLGLKRMEIGFTEKLNQLETENKKLMEELNQAKERIIASDGEIRKIKMEIEQEKTKSATTKEKLGMAVTKGKALVQQRDSLKQALIQKTTELEKCLLDLQEKANALESAEMRNEELIKSTTSTASLQEFFSKRATALDEIEGILSQMEMPDGFQYMDSIEWVRWLLDQKNELLGVSLEYNKLKNILSSLNLPELVASYNLESQISWLGESLAVAEENKTRLEGELTSSMVDVATLESELSEAFDEIENLKKSVSTEKREKDSLQMGLDSLLGKYEAIVEREFQISSEKDRMARMFLEACGVEDEGMFRDSYSDMGMFIQNCVGRIKEQITATLPESSNAGMEQFERIQSLLFVRNQEVVLYKDILDEEIIKRSEMDIVANELQKLSEEIVTLKDERDSMQKDLDRSDEKSSLLREKLSMAVKKGKGLVQEREGLKKSLDEKDTEIEKLKLDLQQQEALANKFSDQINELSSDLERISQLEADVIAMTDQKNQLERYFLESNRMLERVAVSIEGVVLPVDTDFEEPVDKIKWLADSFTESQIKKFDAEQELEKVNEEARSVHGKLTEANVTIKSLEDRLSEAEKINLLLAEEKKAIEITKANLEKELENAREEASSQGIKFVEACENMKSLEDALSQANENTSALEKEMEAAWLDKSSAEKELEKVKEKHDHHASRLEEAYITIKSLEEGLHQLEKTISVLNEEKTAAQAGMASLEIELEKAKSEGDSQTSKLVNVFATVKSLEDSLSVAENTITELTRGKENAVTELQAVNAKLSASMAELAGTHGSLETQSVELFSHLNHLKVIMNNNSLLSALTQAFNIKFESLRDMISLLKNIQEQFVKQGSEQLITDTEEDPYKEKAFSAYTDKFTDSTTDNIEIHTMDDDDVLAYVRKIVEGFDKKNKFVEAKFESFSSYMDELITILLRALQATKNNVVDVLESTGSLKQDVKNLRAYNQAVQSTMVTLNNDIARLHSTWSNAAVSVGLQYNDTSGDLSSNSESGNLLNDLHFGTRKINVDGMEQQGEGLPDGNIYVEAAENFAREAQSRMKELENVKNLTTTTIERLQTKLKDAEIASESTMNELDLNKNRISTLERDLEALQDFCNEMKVKLKDYEAKEDMLKEKDAELTLLRLSLAKKEQETVDRILSEEQVKTLFEKMDQIDILPTDSEDLDKPESQSLSPAERLFSIIDHVPQLQHEMRLLSNDKDELQSSLAQQVVETEHLKKETESLLSMKQELEKTKSDLSEMSLNLERFIQKFGCNDSSVDKKFGVKGLLEVLEDLVLTSIRECETSKLKAEEALAKKEQDTKNCFLSEEQVKTLLEKMDQIDILPKEAYLNISDFHHSGPAGRLFFIIDHVTQLQHEMQLLSNDNEELQSSLEQRVDETEHLKKEAENFLSIKQGLEKAKGDLTEMTLNLERLVQKFGGNDSSLDKKFGVKGLLEVLEDMIVSLVRECETSKLKAQESGAKLQDNQQFVTELSEKVKLLENSVHSRPPMPDPVLERIISKEPSLSTGSEISEIEDVVSVGRSSVSPVPSASLRTMRKGSSDHLALTIDSESDRLINPHEIDDDKGHAFKSLNTSGLIPIQGKPMADRIDGIWVSGGRALMSRPRARLGFLAYWILLHFWVLGSIIL